jgi:Zn-dependent protease
MLDRAVSYALYVNFVWSFLNLLPIHPLDGGQILGQILGPKRRKVTSVIGFVLASLLCVWALSRGLLFSAFMLAMFAYYNLKREMVTGGVVTDRPMRLL